MGFKGVRVVSFSTFLSRIFGFFRDSLIAYTFGATLYTDAFYVAFRIPNLFRRLLGEGALTSAFIPVFKRIHIREDRNYEAKFLKGYFFILLVVVSLIVAIAIISAKYIVMVYAPGFLKYPFLFSLTVKLNKIMFIYLLLVAISSYFMGVLNTYNHFFSPAFSPVLLNLGIIFGVIVALLYQKDVVFLAYGVIFGGFLQTIFQFFFVRRLKIPFGIKWYIDDNVKEVGKLFLPTILGFSAYQLNLLINTVLASMLPKGSISYLYYTDRLVELVLGVFIVAIATVLLPSLSKYAEKGEFDILEKEAGYALQLGFLLSFPALIGLELLGKDIIAILFERGNFTAYATNMTFKSLKFAGFSIISVAVIRISSPIYYALKNTKTPVFISIVAIFINAVFGYFLMQTSLLHAGLSLAYAISTFIQAFLLIFFLWKKENIRIKIVIIEILKIFIGNVLLTTTILFLKRAIMFIEISLFFRILTIIIFSSSIYFITLYFLRSKTFFILLGKK